MLPAPSTRRQRSSSSSLSTPTASRRCAEIALHEPRTPATSTGAHGIRQSPPASASRGSISMARERARRIVTEAPAAGRPSATAPSRTGTDPAGSSAAAWPWCRGLSVPRAAGSARAGRRPGPASTNHTPAGCVRRRQPVHGQREMVREGFERIRLDAIGNPAAVPPDVEAQRREKHRQRAVEVEAVTAASGRDDAPRPTRTDPRSWPVPDGCRWCCTRSVRPGPDGWRSAPLPSGARDGRARDGAGNLRRRARRRPYPARRSPSARRGPPQAQRADHVVDPGHHRHHHGRRHDPRTDRGQRRPGTARCTRRWRRSAAPS